ncbi:MAG TPA: hypothetical protein PLX59_00065 [Candidatus Cloacimonadota bacterium]|nr:hypothetical protein [Candidatus Cloacimonadota bacterium]
MKKPDWPKLIFYLRIVFILITFGAVVYNLISRDWELMLSSVLTLVLFIFTSYLSRKDSLHLPPLFQVFILLFIFGSMYLGEIRDFYYKYRWWDTMLHSSSAMILALTGYIMVYVLNRDKDIDLKLSPFFISLFSFCFALMVGIIWEIFEYGVDSLIGGNMQKARGLLLPDGSYESRLGLIDTMNDLIVDAIGAFIVSALGYYYAKKRSPGENTFTKLKEELIDENPELFDTQEES